jgi:vancomycin resistance protein YoaR
VSDSYEPIAAESAPEAVGAEAAAHEAPAREHRRDARGRRSAPDRGAGRSRAAIVAAVIGAVVLVAVLADVTVSWGRIHPGVRVGEVAVGSMSAAEARTALETFYAHASTTPVVVTWSDKKFDITPASVGARLDATASIDAAMAVGRDGGVLSVVWDRIAATFGGARVAAAITLDSKGSDVALDKIDRAVALAAVDASVTVDGTKSTTSPAHEGRVLDRAATRAEIVAALASNSRTTAAVVVTAHPRVGDAEAARASGEAAKLIAGPVTVTFQGASVVVPRVTVARWVRFSVDTSATAGEPTATAPATVSARFDAKRIGSAISSLAAGRVRPARDATFVTTGGKIRITASQVGTGPDLETLASDLASACISGGPRTAALVLHEAMPRVTTAAARQMGIVGKISSYTTSYSTVNPARTTNVHVLAKAFDGKLVAPGAVFSFNGSAGQRTAAKGYQEAPAIVDGKLVPQLGGGVCQVGTTFFNAVFFSGLPVLERHNHSFYISHYPKGRDATVSWGGPDFKFRNETGHWILIRTSTTASTITIALYGTDPGYTVKYTTSQFMDVVPYKTQEIPDPSLKKGTRIQVDGGVDGGALTVVRTVYDAAGVVVRKDTFVSHYDSKLKIVRVGTKAPSATPTGTVSPKP